MHSGPGAGSKPSIFRKKMRPKNRKGNLPDYAVYRIALVCSERFREVIEAHDPGVHQFEPVQIIWKDGTVDERP